MIKPVYAVKGKLHIVTIPGFPFPYSFTDEFNAKALVKACKENPNYFLNIMPVKGNA